MAGLYAYNFLGKSLEESEIFKLSICKNDFCFSFTWPWQVQKNAFKYYKSISLIYLIATYKYLCLHCTYVIEKKKSMEVQAEN